MNMDHYLGELRQNTASTLALASGLNDVPLQVPANGGWSILQVFEHMYLADRAIRLMLIRTPGDPVEQMEIYGPGLLKERVGYRADRKVQSPEHLQPRGRFGDVETFSADFAAERAELEASVLNGQIIIDRRAVRHNSLGEMSISDWLYFIPYHNERHQEQIRLIRTALASTE